MEIRLVYNEDSQIERIKNANLKPNLFFHFIDERTRKGLKESWKVKGGFAARQSPFAVIYDGEKPVKAFYTEADDDIIESLINYLK